MKYIVIGISDAKEPFFPPEVMNIISNGHIFSGGRRHHEIMSRLLPAKAHWINITIPLDNVFTKYKELDEDIIVFASGDPLFYGFANTIRNRLPDSEIVLFPTFNSLQLLAHRLVMPYHEMRVVSLTGRPWDEMDKALIEGASMIGMLTDNSHTPSAIAQRLLDYGYSQYHMWVGEHLGNAEEEHIYSLSLEEAARMEFNTPNCLIIQGKTGGRRFGIPDNEFELLDGRKKMITKMPIRLLTLQALELPTKKVFWDIGFCTGSVSIEARILFPHLNIESFEIREECGKLMLENSHRFGAPGINIHIGDFLTTDITSLPHPDSVFIGGHGNRIKEILTKVLTVLTPGGCIVMNSVKSAVVESTGRQNSKEMFKEACLDLGLETEEPLRVTLNDYNTIEILKCRQKRQQ